MKKSLFIFIAVLIVIPLQAQNNIITYTANAKLEECTFVGSSGLHVNAFNVSILSHDFSGTTGTITFSGDVTSIGDYAFYGCFDLTSITIPNTVTSIGIFAFAYCSNLTSITLPNSLMSIEFYAFACCSNLTSIMIPNSLTSIGDEAFWFCFGLTSIVVESGNTKYDSRNNCNAIIKTATNTLIVGCMNTTIPNSVTSIGKKAFEHCDGLTSITIPNSVTSIGDRAFYSCDSLTSITIPNSVTSIGNYAFYGCGGLTSMTIPNSVTSIGELAFFQCYGLTSITIPNSVTSIGDEAFRSCFGLTSIVVESGNTKYDSRNNCNAIVETATNTLIAGCMNTIIPNSVTSIGGCAFEHCQNLTSIVIPNSVTSIGDRAFYSCYGLTSITIPESVTSIGNYAFYYCSDLSSITIPESVTSIGDGAFYNCYGLTSITIPKSVSSIGDDAFVGCRSLISIVVESGNTKYDSRNNCNAIIETTSNELIVGCMNTTVPNSVTSIGDSTFYYCHLTSITIPESVTSIGNSAFYGCRGLTSLTCLSLTPPSLGSNVFALVSYDIPLYVHASAIPAYEAADQWNEFDIQPLLVEIDSVSPDTTDLTWLPVDTAALYQLRIYSNQIALDTTLTILANPNNGDTSLQTTASPYRQHRIVLDDEVGTLVVVVFDDNSGATPAQPYRVTISTTSSDMIDIRYDMQVYDITNKIIHQESGLFTLNKKNSLFDALEEVSVSSFSSPSCFDLHGRRYSIEDWHSLPAGIYILSEGGETKKMIKQ